VFLAIVYWLVFALVILSLGALVAVYAGALGAPELQRQIQDELRNATAPSP
jgi:hypothetical protein